MGKDLNNLSMRLKFALRTLNISQTDLAKKINVKPQVIQYLCASQSQKSKFTCEIAEALNIDFLWLASGKGAVPKKIDLLKNERLVPLLSFEQIREWKVQKKEMEITKISKWIPVDEEASSGEFAVEINDRSMAPRFDLNTIIIIEAIKETILQGFVLVYLKQEDFVIFRKLSLINNDKCLMAINKNLHKDIFLQKEDVILGICKEARWNA
jgi:transcriptional regulator with XRE-family HTH domain